MNFLQLNQTEQKQIIEALIFSSDQSLTLEDILNSLIVKGVQNGSNDQFSIKDEFIQNNQDLIDLFEKIIEKINIELALTNRPFGIVESGGAYQYAVRAEYGELLQQVSRHKIKKRLSPAALEVLAIVAYKQPVSKPEIEQIRGVNSNEIVNSLLEKNFIGISGKSDTLGKPLLYSTTDEFLRTFGMSNLNELPKLKEFEELAGFENAYSSLPEDQYIEIENKQILNSEDFEFIKVINEGDIIIPEN